jgi:hypothetical protein
VGKEEEKKMGGFHYMVIKFICFDWICLPLIDGDQIGFSHHHIRLTLLDGKQNGFDCHSWMEIEKKKKKLPQP